MNNSLTDALAAAADPHRVRAYVGTVHAVHTLTVDVDTGDGDTALAIPFIGAPPAVGKQVLVFTFDRGAWAVTNTHPVVTVTPPVTPPAGVQLLAHPVPTGLTTVTIPPSTTATDTTVPGWVFGGGHTVFKKHADGVTMSWDGTRPPPLTAYDLLLPRADAVLDPVKLAASTSNIEVGAVIHNAGTAPVSVTVALRTYSTTGYPAPTAVPMYSIQEAITLAAGASHTVDMTATPIPSGAHSGILSVWATTATTPIAIDVTHITVTG